MADNQVRYRQARYRTLKAQKRCIFCGKKDERTESGEILCLLCWPKHKASHRSIYAERKQLGLCVVCGLEDERTASGKTICSVCWPAKKEAIDRRRQKLKQKQARQRQDLAAMIKKDPVGARQILKDLGHL